MLFSIHVYHVFHWLAKKRLPTKSKIHFTALNLKATYDQKLGTFFGLTRESKIQRTYFEKDKKFLNSSSSTWLYLAGLGPPEAQVKFIGRYCIVTGLELTKDRLGGHVTWTCLGFSKAWLYRDFGPPPSSALGCYVMRYIRIIIIISIPPSPFKAPWHFVHVVLQVLKNDNQLRNADAELQQRAVEYLSLSVRTSSDVLVRNYPVNLPIPPINRAVRFWNRIPSDPLGILARNLPESSKILQCTFGNMPLSSKCTMRFRWSFIFSTYGLYFLPGSIFPIWRGESTSFQQCWIFPKKCPLDQCTSSERNVEFLTTGSPQNQQLLQTPKRLFTWCYHTLGLSIFGYFRNRIPLYQETCFHFQFQQHFFINSSTINVDVP